MPEPRDAPEMRPQSPDSALGYGSYRTDDGQWDILHTDLPYAWCIRQRQSAPGGSSSMVRVSRYYRSQKSALQAFPERWAELTD